MEETDIFTRLARLEGIAPSVYDARGIAYVAFAISFYNRVVTVANPLQLKDYTATVLETLVNPDTLLVLQDTMLKICEEVEKGREQKR